MVYFDDVTAGNWAAVKLLSNAALSAEEVKNAILSAMDDYNEMVVAKK